MTPARLRDLWAYVSAHPVADTDDVAAGLGLDVGDALDALMDLHVQGVVKLGWTATIPLLPLVRGPKVEPWRLTFEQRETGRKLTGRGR